MEQRVVNIHSNINYLHSAIEALLREYPALSEDEQLRADMFEGETDLHKVVSQLVGMAMDCASMSDAVKARMSDLGQRKARYDNKEEGLRALIASLMQTAELSKLVLTEATLSMRTLPPSPIVTDAALLPDDCVRIERKPDMAAIKAAIEGKREVPGTAMSNGKTSLTIRVK